MPGANFYRCKKDNTHKAIADEFKIRGFSIMDTSPLKNAGFDVIVFVPSYDEDLGLITCGNAILSGSIPKVDYIEL